MSEGPFGQRQHLRHVVAIAVRDLLEFLRDRRTVFITLLLPMLMYPIVAISSAVGLRIALLEQERQELPVPLSIAVSGLGAAAFAERIEAVAGATGPAYPLAVEAVTAQEAIMRLDGGRADFWVDVPRDFERSLGADGTMLLEATLGGEAPATDQARRQFAALVEAVSRQAVRERLEQAGLPATAIEPIRLAFRNPLGHSIESGRRPVPSMVGAVLVLLSVLTLTGAFYPAVDAIAGEKERGTIETLLVAPCPAWEIATGKFLAVYVVTVITLVSNLVAIVMTAWVATQYAPRQLALFPSQTFFGVAVAIVSLLALAAVGSAVCLAVTTAARSTKEAQHSLTPVIIAVSLLSGLAVAPQAAAFRLVSAVPIAGQVLVARDALTPLAEGSGKGAAWWMLASLGLTVTSAAVVTGLLMWATGSLLVDEEILFRGPDSTDGVLKRPGRRRLPTVVLALLPAAFGIAALWYGQAFIPDDLLLAIPLQQFFSMLLPLLVLAWWQRVDLVQTFKLGMPGGGGAACVRILAGSALLGVAVFFIAAAAVSVAFGDNASDEAGELSARLSAVVASHAWWRVWLVLAVLPAVCEEAVFRGWMLSGLVGRHTDRPRRAVAIVVQAAVFAGMHLLPERMPSTFLLGLVLGWLVIRSGSILAGIVAHAAHNTMPIAIMALVPGAEGMSVGIAGFLAAGAVAGVAGGFCLVGGCDPARGRVDSGLSSGRHPDACDLPSSDDPRS